MGQSLSVQNVGLLLVVAFLTYSCKEFWNLDHTIDSEEQCPIDETFDAGSNLSLTYQDTRTNYIYPVTKISFGDTVQYWFAENLTYGEFTQNRTPFPFNGKIDMYCYFDSMDSCYVFGGYYFWDELIFDAVRNSNCPEADFSIGLCPPGTRLPTKSDFDRLKRKYLAVDVLEGGEVGLNMVGAGGYTNISANPNIWLDDITFYWSSTPDSLEAGKAFSLRIIPASLDMRVVSIGKLSGAHVRCIVNVQPQ